jgi:hypothetical protein
MMLSTAGTPVNSSGLSVAAGGVVEVALALGTGVAVAVAVGA